ncbi:MAG: radical SAM protein [Candidatus Adiutrix sp.]|jgi:radical SAM superfamily enzyme YgiQ (UPF0313 family)|nr:radical SAM protein [Candidatus Adiutrix sp.]
MNCLLVLPVTSLDEYRRACSPGLPLISASLKRMGGLKVVNLNLELEAGGDTRAQRVKLVSIMEEERIEAVLSGGFAPNWVSLRMIFETAKAVNPAVVTITGGTILTGAPEAAMRLIEFADYGIIGEGEITVAELITALKNKGPVKAVAGLVIKEAEGFYLTAPRRLIADWRDIPRPDYESFGVVDYLANLGTDVESYNERIFIHSGRGCPFQCTFCHNSRERSRYRPRPLDDFMAELRHWLNLGLASRHLDIDSDLLAESKPRLRELCSRLKELEFKGWGINMRVSQVDEEAIALLQEAGCGYVGLGLESACDRILQSMNKRISVKQMERALDILKRNNLSCLGTFIFGDVEETRETAHETLAWWEAHPDYMIFLGTITLYPGTVLYKRALALGRIKDETEHIKNLYPLVNISKMSDDEYACLLGEIYEKLLGRFHNPKVQLDRQREVYDFHFQSVKRKISGRCRQCGAWIDYISHFKLRRHHCPYCGAIFGSPYFQLPSWNEGLKASLERLFQKYDRLAFWGIGRLFRSAVPPEFSDQPGILLMDSKPGGFYGAKPVEGPAALADQIEEGHAPVLVIAVNPYTAAYQAIYDAAANRYGLKHIASLHILAEESAVELGDG